MWTSWHGLFSILVPVYAFILLSARTALAGDTERFLERSAAIQWGLMVCVYFVSHVALVVTLMGFTGGLIMSAIKRDRGVKDYGAMLGGHGGVLDRIDSLCFSAPVFFHLTRYFYAA